MRRLQRGPRFVIGSVLLLRAEALEQVGGFDERFFLYAEETDWAYRAHLLGWRHAAVPESGRAHRRRDEPDARRREAHFHASQERYFRKHFGSAGWQRRAGGGLARRDGARGRPDGDRGRRRDDARRSTDSGRCGSNGRLRERIA